MKLLKTLVILFVWLFAANVIAQSLASFKGSWQAVYQDSKGRDRSADMTFDDKGGSWRDVADPSKKNRGACHREFPLLVKIDAQGDIGIVVDPSDNIQGCGDHEMVLRRVDENNLAGVLKDGRPIKLTRKQ